jgi:nitrogen regulatory protein PII
VLHPATKLTIIAEHFLLEKISKLIESCGGKGYTISPVGGKGLQYLRATFDKATVVEGFDNLQIEVITTDRVNAERIAERVLVECFTDYSGVIYIEKVEVYRRERF